MLIQSIARIVALAMLIATSGPPALAAGETRPIAIAVLGDSLAAGLGLAEADAFPARLESALKARGQAVMIVNAGVSGDLASGGLARLDWSVGSDVDAVIVELGANDALRGLDPQETEAALAAILNRLSERRLPVLLAGLRAPPNLGAEYAARFDAIYPALAKRHNVVFYPFFLDGVAANRRLNQPDGIHPNEEGVTRIVESILPSVEELIRRVRAGS